MSKLIFQQNGRWPDCVTLNLSLSVPFKSLNLFVAFFRDKRLIIWIISIIVRHMKIILKIHTLLRRSTKPASRSYSKEEICISDQALLVRACMFTCKNPIKRYPSPYAKTIYFGGVEHASKIAFKSKGQKFMNIPLRLVSSFYQTFMSFSFFDENLFVLLLIAALCVSAWT